MADAGCGQKLREIRGEQSAEAERQAKYICLNLIEGFTDSFEVFDTTFPLVPKGGLLRAQYTLSMQKKRLIFDGGELESGSLIG
jgi:hypothetical protein